HRAGDPRQPLHPLGWARFAHPTSLLPGTTTSTPGRLRGTTTDVAVSSNSPAAVAARAGPLMRFGVLDDVDHHPRHVVHHLDHADVELMLAPEVVDVGERDVELSAERGKGQTAVGWVGTRGEKGLEFRVRCVLQGFGEFLIGNTINEAAHGHVRAGCWRDTAALAQLTFSDFRQWFVGLFHRRSIRGRPASSSSIYRRFSGAGS